MQRIRYCAAILFLAATACSATDSHGVADKRSDFTQFVPMHTDPGRDGLKEVRAYFRRANRSEIIGVIEHACAGGRAGRSVYDEKTGAGYYVNCNPHNKQLLNGYVSANPRVEPHSH